MFSQWLLISWWSSFGFIHHVIDVRSCVSKEGTASIFCVTYSGLWRSFSILVVQIKSPWRSRQYIPLECWKTTFIPWWLSTMVYISETILYVAMQYIYCQIQLTYPTFILLYSFVCPWQISSGSTKQCCSHFNTTHWHLFSC